ncbi:PTS sugar transporter subunit IIA [Agrococcus carbonis]|uniref:Ascorbate-specific PTS system EIIA component n=1 Tax=Agrococcus carbonis TaxID=684552 RepID=A0A1H1NYA2_9MICO|nr:PTS sugar transporter subunit IIA [Agrococcus carbonis]SDS03966.1 PTS system, ascorbate-specific IIA component [Agrococcus carbonis]
MNLADSLPEEAIQVGARADDWRDAVRLAGDRLVATGVATEAYTDEMIAAIDAHGPYVVIAPGFALAHSRPSPAVRRTGISWVSFAEPVPFGHAVNDPVRLVVGLAATDHDGHIEMMAALAGVLAEPAVLEELSAATSPAGVRAILSRASGS